MAYISDTLRELIFSRAKHVCEYCLAPQYFVVEMEIDHIIPIALGGESVADNLCLSCRSCNSYKRTMTTITLSNQSEAVALFNPRQQTWSSHFEFIVETGEIRGITPSGQATVHQLKINAPDRKRYRMLWFSLGLYPP